MSWIYHIYQIGNAEVHLPRTAANKKLRDEWTLLTEHIELAKFFNSANIVIA